MKEFLPDPFPETHAGKRRKSAAECAARKRKKRHGDHDKSHINDIGEIFVCDPHVNDLCHHTGDGDFHQYLANHDEGCKYRIFFVFAE